MALTVRFPGVLPLVIKIFYLVLCEIRLAVFLSLPVNPATECRIIISVPLITDLFTTRIQLINRITHHELVRIDTVDVLLWVLANPCSK